MFARTDLRILALVILGATFPVSYLAAQETPDTTSVAEAARRARENKQTASKPAKVVTNDTLAPAPTSPPATTPAPAVKPGASENIPSTPDKVSEISAPASGEPQSAASAKDEEKDKAEIESLKRLLKEKEHAASLLQRELALEQDNFYRQQDYQRDSAGKQKLDGMQADLQQMQDELAALKAKLTDLVGPDALKQASNPNAPESSTPPAQPQP